MLLFEKRNLITLYSESTGYKSCALFFALFFLLAPYFFPISEPLRPVSCYSNGLLWLHPLVHYIRIQFCVVNHYSARALLPLWQRYSGPASKLYWRIQNITHNIFFPIRLHLFSHKIILPIRLHLISHKRIL